MGWIPSKETREIISWALSILVVAGAASWALFTYVFPANKPSEDRPTVSSTAQSGGQTAHTIYNLNQPPTDNKKANLTFEKIDIFFVSLGDMGYQIGIILKLHNNDAYSRILTGIDLDPLLFQLRGGNMYLRKFFVTELSAKNNDTMAIGPNSYGVFKILLPIRWEIQFLGDTVPEVVFVNPLTLVFADGVEPLRGVQPYRFGNFPRVITEAEWNRLLRAGSAVDTDDIIEKSVPLDVDINGPTREFILFNADRSARIDVYGFDKTDMKKSDAGVLVMLRGKGAPRLERGWELLATSYEELQRDPANLKKYESALPRDKSGALLRLDAGFRGADVVTFGPFSERQARRP